MKVIISDNVKISISDIFNYLSNISTQYASKTINNIYKTIVDIKSAPYIGRYVPELSDNHFRERIYKDFRIIYFVSESTNTIYIEYVFSRKQDSNLFFKVHRKEILKFLNQFLFKSF